MVKILKDIKNVKLVISLLSSIYPHMLLIVLFVRYYAHIHKCTSCQHGFLPRKHNATQRLFIYAYQDILRAINECQQFLTLVLTPSVISFLLRRISVLLKISSLKLSLVLLFIITKYLKNKATGK